ncbi:MAG: citrate/2-methylcitrate synthase [Candidatus Heimdallarchaeota archaeon]
MPERKLEVVGNYEGLRGINVGYTKICPVGEEGIGLSYRGYPIEILARNSNFEEVSYLLVHGELPTQKQLRDWKSQIVNARVIPKQIMDLLDNLPPTTHPMSVLRTGISTLGTLEPEKDHEGIPQAIRILGILPSLIGYWETRRGIRDKRNLFHTNEDTIAGYLLQMLTGTSPDHLDREMLDKSLILYAEHEFAASTFALRVCASTLADYYSCVATAIGTLSGPLNGGANEAAIKFMLQFTDADDAERGVREKLANRELIFGFGHAVYAGHDPRSKIIKEIAENLSNARPKLRNLFEIATRIENVMEEKGMYPNLDFYTSTAYYMANIDIPLFTPIFVVSRFSGWAAHILEQRAHNKLIRPTAEYIGPIDRNYIPIEQR